MSLGSQGHQGETLLGNAWAWVLFINTLGHLEIPFWNLGIFSSIKKLTSHSFLFLKTVLKYDCYTKIAGIYLFIYSFIHSLTKDMFIDEREKERNISVREKHQLVASCTCLDWELNPQPRYVS